MSATATTTDINNYDTDYDDLLDLDTAAMIKALAREYSGRRVDDQMLDWDEFSLF